MGAIANKQIVLDTYAALNAGDSAGYFAGMRDDVTVTYYGTHRVSGTYRGKADLMANLVPTARAAGWHDQAARAARGRRG